jgi:hypothetical protein
VINYEKEKTLAHQVNCSNVAIGGFASGFNALVFVSTQICSRFVPVAEVQATTGQLILI